MKHEDSGNRCLMGHADGIQCIVCKHCGKYFRKEEMDEECPNDAPDWRKKELNWRPK